MKGWDNGASMRLKKCFFLPLIAIASCFLAGGVYAGTSNPSDDCMPGYFFDSAYGGCVICPVGNYCVNNLQRECNAHSIAPSSGMTTCTYCSGETLRYADISHTKCVRCDGARDVVLNGVCMSCPSGYVADSDHTECVECGAGSYLQDGECIVCPVGHSCSGDGTAVPCEKGTYSVEEGASACSLCDTGFSTKISGATSCDTCAAGFYASGRGCVECQAGYACPGGGKSPYICPRGSYSEAGAGLCVSCDTGYSTDNNGATSADECNTCVPGYYYNQNNRCELCMAGYSCPGGRTDASVCPKGSFSDDGAESCTKCPNGYTTTGSETPFSDDACIFAVIKLGRGRIGPSINLPTSLKYGKINTSIVKNR